MAQDVIDVILGEAKGGSWEDMLGVASVIYNRARDARATPEQIVKIPSQFNAYGKALPAGVGKYRSLAQKAWDQVQKTGPVHDGSYQMSGGLKPKVKGLVEVAAVPGGHVYYKDPQARPIATTEGYRKPQPIQTAQLTGKASASAEGFADLGKKGNGLGLMNLAPSMVANDGTVKTAMADPRMNPKVGEIAASLNRGGFGDVGIRSGFRTVAENRAVGGARNSQHLYGTAMDLGVKDLPDQQKADILDRALMGGAKGIGLYNSGAMHVDARENPAFWGPNRNDAYAGTTAAAAPGWARPMVSQNLDGSGVYLPMLAKNIPIPTPRQPANLMAAARQAERSVPTPQPIQASAFAQGGILGPSSISLNPVGTANAGEMPKTKSGYSDTRPMPINRPAIAPPAMRDRPMPSGPLPTQKKATTVDPAVLAANYGYYGQTRSAAPVLPVDGPSLASVPRIQATGTAGEMTTPQIAGPPANQGITPATFPPAPPKPTMQQKAKGALQNMLSPENLKKVGGSAIGSALGGPIGGVIGGLLAGQMGNKGGQGILGNLAKAIGPSNYNNPLQSTYIGNGVNAVSNAMWGNRRGDTATYNSQGGGSVTNLGGGQYQRTSNKYGFTEIVNADGSRSTVSTKKK